MLSVCLVSESVRPLFWSANGNGLVAMMHCYFDDSGTHAGAPFVVWGGLIGKAAAFDKLNAEWVKVLAEPFPGKPQIRKMRMSSLCASQGDFLGYGQGERDLLRKRFRDVIVGCDVAAIAYVVNVQDWEQVSTSTDRTFLGDAGNLAFAGIMEAVAALAGIDGEGVSCHLDKGAENIGTRSVKAAWEFARPDFASKCHFTYSAVEAMPSLQAADLIAYEAYHYGLHLQDPDKVKENPHFVRLRESINVLFQFMERDELIQSLEKFRPAIRLLSEQFSMPG